MDTDTRGYNHILYLSDMQAILSRGKIWHTDSIGFWSPQSTYLLPTLIYLLLVRGTAKAWQKGFWCRKPTPLPHRPGKTARTLQVPEKSFYNFWSIPELWLPVAFNSFYWGACDGLLVTIFFFVWQINIAYEWLHNKPIHKFCLYRNRWLYCENMLLDIFYSILGNIYWAAQLRWHLSNTHTHIYIYIYLYIYI